LSAGSPSPGLPRSNVLRFPAQRWAGFDRRSNRFRGIERACIDDSIVKDTVEKRHLIRVELKERREALLASRYGRVDSALLAAVRIKVPGG
jgi:hypothetical protein